MTKLQEGLENRPFRVTESNLTTRPAARSNRKGEEADASDCGRWAFASYAQAQGGSEFFALVESNWGAKS
jgi:hypothetical protein